MLVYLSLFCMRLHLHSETRGETFLLLIPEEAKLRWSGHCRWCWVKEETHHTVCEVVSRIHTAFSRILGGEKGSGATPIAVYF